jgi:hypothetical protein
MEKMVVLRFGMSDGVGTHEGEPIFRSEYQVVFQNRKIERGNGTILASNTPDTFYLKTKLRPEQTFGEIHIQGVDETRNDRTDVVDATVSLTRSRFDKIERFNHQQFSNDAFGRPTYYASNFDFNTQFAQQINIAQENLLNNWGNVGFVFTDSFVENPANIVTGTITGTFTTGITIQGSPVHL